VTRSSAAFDRFSRIVDGPMVVLSVIWLGIIVVPLFVHTSGQLATSLEVTDYSIWALFAVEYLGKLALVLDRRRYFVNHLFDLAVVAIPILRPVRVLQVLRAVRPVTVMGDMGTRAHAILAHRGLRWVLLAAVAIVFACAGLELAFERNAPGANIHDFGQALWFSIVTLTTVGYGDRYPVSGAGQGVAVVLMLSGIGLVGTIAATVASYFVEEETDPIRADIEAMRSDLEAIRLLLESLLRSARPAAEEPEA
jgi:voltage-gated potassium channel